MSCFINLPREKTKTKSTLKISGGIQLRGRRSRTTEHHVRHAVAKLRRREGGEHARQEEVRRPRGLTLGGHRETGTLSGKTL